MGLENVLNGFKRFRRKIITSALIGTTLAGCSSGSDNQGTPTGPNNPKPPTQTQNSSPVITSSPLTQCNEQFSYSYPIEARDSDGDNLTYTLSQAPTWLTISNNVVSGICPEVSQNTSFPVKIRVSDGKSSPEQSYNLSIMNLFNTYVSSTEQLNNLSGVTQTNLTFSQPTNFVEKDIIGSGINSKTPNGILREVTSISADKKNLIQNSREYLKVQRGYLGKLGYLFAKMIRGFLDLNK